MQNRIALRETIETKEYKSTSPEEKFQNLTLRPILKLQNKILLALFKNYITESKNTFETFSIENKKLFVENSLQKNIVLKNKLIGATIGMFTEDELDIYLSQTSTYNKRIMGLLMERVRSQVEEL